jgi:hypothetical protein
LTPKEKGGDSVLLQNSFNVISRKEFHFTFAILEERNSTEDKHAILSKG